MEWETTLVPYPHLPRWAPEHCFNFIIPDCIQTESPSLVSTISSHEDDTDAVVLSGPAELQVSEIHPLPFQEDCHPNCTELDPGLAKQDKSKTRMSKQGVRINEAGTRARHGDSGNNSGLDIVEVHSVDSDTVSPHAKSEDCHEHHKPRIVPACPEQHGITPVTQVHEQGLHTRVLADGRDARRQRNVMAARKSRAKKRVENGVLEGKVLALEKKSRALEMQWYNVRASFNKFQQELDSMNAIWLEDFAQVS
ncbi:uncharacterized protein B0I36DRAFT_332135 [Microdochium trichocladiopsis]|uniref:BZIP domain-containing protein n=1 Tax=Microdochium trichocladiopsis TaxID=1682393 RepID=A0A9P8XXX9_9PEZI|nr:uncharacterized protein B0I36DRAFT_332135 [Microdochium trichocladiopsis]KAH7024858.1 hypothetical protein B0I36DRAFT_332135 [Microdochium trichocladiopsis]